MRPLDVERDLKRPARVLPRIARAAVLVHLAEAAVRRRAGGQPVVAAEDAEVLLRRRIVIGVDDRDRLARAGRRRRREAVDRLDRRRGESGRGARGLRIPVPVGRHEYVAAGVIRHRARTHRPRIRMTVHAVRRTRERDARGDRCADSPSCPRPTHHAVSLLDPYGPTQGRPQPARPQPPRRWS